MSSLSKAITRLDDLRAAESRRVDEQMALRAEYSSNLANQISQSAETLRVLIAATASTQAQQLSALTTQLTDRLSSLEKAQYQDSGSKGGVKDLMGWIVGAIMTLIAISSFIIPKLK